MMFIDRCPHCGGTMIKDHDDCGDYYSCLYCSHEFNMDLTPMRVTVQQLYKQRGIKLYSYNKPAHLEPS